MKQQYKFTYLFISHDMSVVKHVCQRIVVMYLGNIVEIAQNETLFSNPLHPYTKALLNAVPIIGKKKKHDLISGEVPSPINPPSGCVFHPRCPYARKECSETPPALREIEPGHFVACWQ